MRNDYHGVIKNQAVAAAVREQKVEVQMIMAEP